MDAGGVLGRQGCLSPTHALCTVPAEGAKCPLTQVPKSYSPRGSQTGSICLNAARVHV